MFCLCSFLGFLWCHVLHFSLFKLFWVNSGDLDSVWSTPLQLHIGPTLQSPWAVSVQPALVPLLGFAGWSLSFSPGLYTWLRVFCAGECNKAARTICAMVLPSTGGWLHSPWAFKAPYLSQLISQPLKGAPRVRELFFFHSSTRGTGPVSIPFFFFLFHLPGYLVVFLAFLVVWDLSPSTQ